MPRWYIKRVPGSSWSPVHEEPGNQELEGMMAVSWADRYVEQRPKAVELYGRAKGVIAGGVGHDVRYNAVAPMYIEHARGSRKWDVDGNEYIDYGMGNGALLVGHSHPAAI